MFGNSPFLSEALLAEPGVLRSLLLEGPDAALERLIEPACAPRRAEPAGPGDGGLRQIAKRRLALLIGLADLAGLWPLERVTAALSRFADLAVQRALELALAEAAARGEIELADPGRSPTPASSCSAWASSAAASSTTRATST